MTREHCLFCSFVCASFDSINLEHKSHFQKSGLHEANNLIATKQTELRMLFLLTSENSLLLPCLAIALINSNIPRSKLLQDNQKYQDVVNLANIHMSVMWGIDAASN